MNTNKESRENMKPKYNVELIKKGRSRYYEVTNAPGVEGSLKYGSVSSCLTVIAKPALIPWAKKEALLSVESELKRRMKNKDKARITLNDVWISEMLLAAKKQPDKIKDDAAEFGTQSHDYIEKIINGKDLKVPEKFSGPVEAFKEWWIGSGMEFVMAETSVASVNYGYGGRLDAVGMRHGHYVLLDWKTGNGIYDEAALQVGAYANALKETYGIEVKEAIIVRFGKKLPIEFEVKELMDIDQSFNGFLVAKQLKENLKRSQFIEF